MVYAKWNNCSRRQKGKQNTHHIPAAREVLFHKIFSAEKKIANISPYGKQRTIIVLYIYIYISFENILDRNLQHIWKEECPRQASELMCVQSSASFHPGFWYFQHLIHLSLLTKAELLGDTICNVLINVCYQKCKCLQHFEEYWLLYFFTGKRWVLNILG